MRMMPRPDRPGAHRQPAGPDSGITQGNRIRRLKPLWQVEVAQRFPIHADVPAREAVKRYQRRARRRYASNQKFSASHAGLLAAALVVGSESIVNSLRLGR